MNWIRFCVPVFCAGVAAAQSVGTFTPTRNMTTRRIGHTATLLNDGRVLIAGGDTADGSGPPDSSLASAELYDPAAGTFTATGNMTTPRSWHRATLLADGKVLIAGGSIVQGSGRREILASAEIYDPDPGTFNAVADMTAPRMNLTATLLGNGQVLIAGGYGNGSNLDSAELYDPLTARFGPTGNMTSPWADTATLLPNGNVLIYRGGPDQAPLCYAELYDPSAGRFSCTGNSITNHSGPTATVLTNGKVLIAGGDIGDGDGATDRAEVYDPATGVFTAAGRMTIARESNTATLLSDGSVLLAGGHLTELGPVTAEVYDSGNSTFNATYNMVTPRENHTATLLIDGGVLITGGIHPPFWFVDTVLLSAEIYTPSALIPPAALLSLSGDGKGQGAIQHADTHQLVTADNPAVVGENVVIYCMRLIDGSVIPPQVAIGGRMAEVLWFGNTPGFGGLNQINVRVPSGVAPGAAVSVRMNYIGRPSHEVTIAVR